MGLSPENQQKCYEDIIALLPGHVYWKDKDGVFLGCNIAQARDAGFDSPEDLIGKSDYDMPWSIQADYIREMDLAVMHSKKVNTLEELFELPNGTKKMYLSKKLPLFNEENEVIGILGISFDITDRKELEDELQQATTLAEAASQAKTEFLENMRHDIRTPLTGIIGFSNIIKNETDNLQIKQYAENLVASSNTLLSFLNEILETITVVSGDVPNLKKKFNLKAKLAEVIKLLTPRALEKNLALSFEYTDDLPNYLIGDQIRISRVFLELIANALNFTNTGSVALSVKLAKNSNNKKIVLSFVVKDTGIGMPENKRKEIFLRFKRLTPSYQGIYHGAGLGLAIVKQFIDDLGGEIYCESEENVGTKFTALLQLETPLLDDDSYVDDLPEDLQSMNMHHTSTPEVTLTSPLQGEDTEHKILVVEDSLLAAKVAESIISSLGFSVDIAKCATETLDLIGKNKYALIFMDVGLPDISGIDCTKQIRATEWKTNSHTPIIALTAHIDRENKESCIISGMDAVLSKPLSKETADKILSAFIPSKNNLANNENNDIAGKTIDLELGATQHNGNKDRAIELITLLLASLEKEKNALLFAKSKNHWQGIKSIVHKLQGSTSYCGTPRLHQACINFGRKYSSDSLNSEKNKLFDIVLAEIERLEDEKLD